MPREAAYEIMVGGIDVSRNFNPILENLLVRLTRGVHSDQAHIQLNDEYGQIAMPGVGAPCEISLGWNDTGIVSCFTGFIDQVRFKGNRHAGRTMIIGAKSYDPTGEVKSHQEHHKDNSPLSGFMGAAAGKAGVGFSAQGDIAGKFREYWAATSESFLHLGHRIAGEVGANFKIIGNTAYMWPINTPLFAGDCYATWGDNLIDWDLVPVISRPRFGSTKARHYDMKAMKWLESQTGGGGGGGSHMHRSTRADGGEAGDSAGNNAGHSEREGGSGSVLILGFPGAYPESICTVSGVGGGADGGYRIDTVEHLISRGEGFHSHIGLKARNA